MQSSRDGDERNSHEHRLATQSHSLHIFAPMGCRGEQLARLRAARVERSFSNRVGSNYNYSVACMA
jgi:hypothetical protein